MAMEIDIGIDKKDRKAIADGLSHLLADVRRQRSLDKAA